MPSTPKKTTRKSAKAVKADDQVIPGVPGS